MQKNPAMPQGAGMSAYAVGRNAPRFTLLIRTAKLIIDDQQFLCIIRDISATGFCIRSFHPIVEGRQMMLELQSGERHPADMVWQKEAEAGFKFHFPAKVDAIVMGVSDYPKRDLRFELEHPVMLHTNSGKLPATIVNLSRQGGNICCAGNLSIDQMIRIEASGLPDIEARVRWRGDGVYGLVFDTTFSLADLALLIRNLNLRYRSGSSISRG